MSKRKLADKSSTKITKFIKSNDDSSQPHTSKNPSIFHNYEEFLAKIDADRQGVS